MERGHRRVFYAVDGTARLPGRFAVDWMKVDSEGRLAEGDEDVVENYHGYGEDVLAVADGVVVAVRDDVGDPATRSGKPRPSIHDASGNYIIIDIGNGRFAVYEHLKRGLRVTVGDAVRRGQVIGALGFTGQASAPHLHFHVADRPALLAAEGRPYTLSGFRELGRYEAIEQIGQSVRWIQNDGVAERMNAFPAPNVVVEFVGNPKPD
jgi:hypothetical protein